MAKKYFHAEKFDNVSKRACHSIQARIVNMVSGTVRSLDMGTMTAMDKKHSAVENCCDRVV